MSRLMFLLLLVPFAATLPACQTARSNFLKSEFGSVMPLPPNAETPKVDVDPKFTTANLKVGFESERPPAEIVAYYQRELVARGFSLDIKYSYGDSFPGSRDASPETASPQSLRGQWYEFKRGNDVIWLDRIQLFVNWRSATGPCEVTVILRHNSYLGVFAEAPVVLPIAVVCLPLLPTGEGYGVLVYQWKCAIVDLLY